jgi:hypothetical protein
MNVEFLIKNFLTGLTFNEKCDFVCCDITVCVSFVSPLFVGHAIVS